MLAARFSTFPWSITCGDGPHRPPWDQRLLIGCLIYALWIMTCDILDDAAHLHHFPKLWWTPSNHSDFLLVDYINISDPAMSNGGTNSAAQEKINTDIVTLTRFLTEEQTKHKEATGDFTYAVSPRKCSESQTDESLSTVSCAMLFNSRLNLLLTIFVEQPW